MAFQSLYRRFRPQRFDEVKGQAHLVSALQNAVREDRVGHAYLLSGPRGTGKTSTARLLAKALNCDDLGDDGEPCCACPSCIAIENGSSMDLFELDAASNRGIDDVKDLVRSVAMGTPGRRKVYILDEVHMLTKEASNALLKTLEEPPDHVVFVLATTDPQKVLPTIRSRTQHIELSLVGAELMAEHVREVAAAADLDLDDSVIEHVVRRGGGSVRDTLSALDQVVAAGGIGDTHLSLEGIVEALAARDVKAALSAVATAVSSGGDPRDLTEQLTRHLRDMFLVAQQVPPPELSADMVAALGEQAAALGVAATVRALEQLGTALVDMRQAADARLVLEVTLVRLTAPAATNDVTDLLGRIEQLEAAVARLTAAPAAAEPAPTTIEQGPSPAPEAAPAAPPPPPTTRAGSKVSAARQALASAQPTPPASADAAPDPSSAAPDPAPASAPAEAPVPDQPAADPPPSGTAPDAAAIAAAWTDHIAEQLAPRVKSRFQVGAWTDAGPGVVRYVLPNEHYRDRCAEVSGEVAAAIAAHLGGPVSLEVVVGDGADEPDPSVPTDSGDDVAADDIDTFDTSELTDAPAAAASGAERLRAAFPGASIVEEGSA